MEINIRASGIYFSKKAATWYYCRCKNKYANVQLIRIGDTTWYVKVEN